MKEYLEGYWKGYLYAQNQCLLWAKHGDIHYVEREAERSRKTANSVLYNMKTSPDIDPDSYYPE